METNYEKQAVDFLEKTGCKMTISYKENRKYFPEDKDSRDVYDVEIKRGQRVWRFEFGNSIFKSQQCESPSEYDILACITKYDPRSFENFCSEFGYDEDSKTAERTYKAVRDEWMNVCRIWTDEEIEKLQEIQ